MGYDRADFAREPDVIPEVLEHFDAWRVLLLKWNRRINLVSPRAVGEFWQRHALDSWQLAVHVPEGVRSAIDLGSGAGFPGLAVAIALKMRGEGRVLLVESAGKKANFLRTVARELNLPADVTSERAEDLPEREVDLVTARAFAPLPKLLEYSASFWSANTVGLFPKGENVQTEIDCALEDWIFNFFILQSRTDLDAGILRVGGLERIA